MLLIKINFPLFIRIKYCRVIHIFRVSILMNYHAIDALYYHPILSRISDFMYYVYFKLTML